MTQEPGTIFEAVYESGTTGLVGLLEVAIQDNQNLFVDGPTGVGIIELVIDGQPTGRYRAMLTAPAAEGTYSIHWSDDGSFNPNIGGGVEDLIIQDLGFALPPLGPDGDDAIICNLWTDTTEVLNCCTADNVSSDASELTNALIAASEFLFAASGRQWPGMCMRTVRPCDEGCGCGYQVLSRGHLVGWDGNCWDHDQGCDCFPVSRVKLPGYVQSINEVRIDGVVLDPAEYGVLDHEELIRIGGERWPRCQSTDLPDTEPGTFSVTYTYGKAPPVMAQLAATKLACEIVKSCTPDVECALPDGVVRITREGITVERILLLRQGRSWATGIGELDFFLNAFNPNGLKRTAVAWSPVRGSDFARPELQ